MSDFRNGEIKLDSSKAVYYSGQLVSGTVSFTLSKPLNFSAINILYHGEAEVLWTENMKEVQFGRERIKAVEYKGNEEYFKYTECLAGGLGINLLPAGPHSLPFKFHIPHKAPSSFKGEVGTVTYSITATLIFPEENVLNEALFKEFQVVAPFDLNAGSPDIKWPIALDYEKVYGCDCFCGMEKALSIHVNVPVSGFCPGQNIPITIEIDNESNTEINKMKFEIIQREKYRSYQLPGEYVPPEKIVAKLKKGAVMAGSKKSMAFNLQVPDFLPVYLENCSIINVTYFFKVTFKLSACKSNLHDEAEISLGLIPLSGFTNGDYYHPMRDNLPEGPIPDPNQTLEFDPTKFVQPARNPYLDEKSQFTPAFNTQYPTPAPYPANPSTYPASQSTYPASPSTYPASQATFPANPNYPMNNSRPSSGSYGFLVGSSPGYPTQGYGNGTSNVNVPSGGTPSAPPPYA